GAPCHQIVYPPAPPADPTAAALAPNQAAVGTTQVTDAPAAQGFTHFIAQSDIIGKSLFVVLIVMSLASWYLIVVKSISNMRTKRRSQHFLDKFWQSTSLDAVANEIRSEERRVGKEGRGRWGPEK